MSLRTITTTDQLKPWLPSDYSGTGWTDTDIAAALASGDDPRLIAAEIWEEYAGTLPEETGDSRPVTRVSNLDVQVEYGTAMSPRDWAMKQARFHRSRAKVRHVALGHTRITADAPEGLIQPPPKTK